MPDSGCAHIAAITSVKQPKRRECEECVKIAEQFVASGLVAYALDPDVLAGKTYLAPAAAAKVAEGVTRVRITPREMATLRLLADGKAKEIASELDVSERTVKTYLGHLFEKLGVTSRTEAIKIATRRGLVRLE